MRTYLRSNSTWTVRQDITGFGQFGTSLDIVNTGMLVGAPSLFPQGSSSPDGGAIFYRFNRRDQAWSPFGSTLSGTGGAISAREEFGKSVAASRLFRVAVGAPQRDSGIGGVYMMQYKQVTPGSSTFDWIPMTGSPQVGRSTGDAFGSAVDISFDGNRVIAGSPNGAGYIAVYVVGSLEDWSEEFTKDGSVANGGFGSSVYFLSKDGDTFVVGSPGSGGGGTVQVYKLQSGQFAQLGPDIVGTSGDSIGRPGTVSGGMAGATPFVLTGTSSGTVKRFDYNQATNSWFESYQPTPVGISGGITSVATGLTEDFMGGNVDSRTAAIFASAAGPSPSSLPTPPTTILPSISPTRQPVIPSTPTNRPVTQPPTSAPVPPASPTTSPVQRPTFAPTSTLGWRLQGGPFSGSANSNLGASVALSGSYMAAGATSGSGLVQTYLKSASNSWASLATINGATQDTLFGFSVDIGNGVLLVGEPKSAASDNPNLVTGSASYYEFDQALVRWNQLGSSVEGDPADSFRANEQFGWSVALSSNRVIICGAPFNSEFGVSETGRVYTFQFLTSINNWAPRQAVPITGKAPGDNLGYAVDISSDGSTMIAGGPGRNNFSGYAVVYQWDGRRWSAFNELLASSLTSDEQFGTSVCVLSSDGEYVAVGAPNYNNFRGAIRVFQRGQGTNLGTYQSFGPEIAGNVGEGLGLRDSFSGSVDVSTGNIIILAATSAGNVRRYVYNSAANRWDEDPLTAARTGISSPAFGGDASPGSISSSFVIGGVNEAKIYALP